MESNKEIIKYLFKTGAYKDLEDPVILTSGEIGIYYVNTEELVEDGGKFEVYGDDPIDMIAHAINMTKESKIFKKVIDILTEKVSKNIDEHIDEINELNGVTISGGQRRDWLFSGPVANNLDLPHLAIFKNGNTMLIYKGRELKSPNLGSLDKKNYDIHVADLLTKGSSAVDVWIPTIRDTGRTINDMYNVVTRQQGGEEALKKLNVNSHSEVAIDSEFIEDGQGTPGYKKRALTYMKDPKDWSERYIAIQGIDAFVNVFDLKEGKPDRAAKFLNIYNNILKQTGKYNELKSKAMEMMWEKHFQKK